MKHNIIYLCFVIFIGLSSCSDWLDVQPKSEIKSEVTFTSEGGFKDALIGVYLLMTDQDIYGGEMTFGFMESIAQNYAAYSSSSKHYYALRYTYGRYENTINGFWSTSYNVIANINNIIENLESNKSVMREETYSVIKGEALGLRAYIHFDLLRLFGFGDLAKKPENFDKLCIPYVSKYHKVPERQMTVKEVLDFIKTDLLESHRLLNTYGPYGTIPKKQDYYLPNDDKFFTNRKNRFNFWAANCTLARVYMWTGEYDKALPLLKHFIDDGGKTSWVSSYSIDNYYEKSRDLVFTTEHVFNLEISGTNDLFSRIKYHIDPTADDPNANYQLYYQKPNVVKELFDVGKGGENDYRYRRHYNTKNNYFQSNTVVKFWECQDYTYGKVMPLIRRSEVYYMLAETLLSTGKDNDRKEAISLLNTVRRYRGWNSDTNLEQSLTKEQIQDEITKEYRREFICEGQLFYYYKRLGFVKIPNTTRQGSDAIYVLPMPKGDVEMGGFEDYKD